MRCLRHEKAQTVTVVSGSMGASTGHPEPVGREGLGPGSRRKGRRARRGAPEGPWRPGCYRRARVDGRGQRADGRQTRRPRPPAPVPRLAPGPPGGRGPSSTRSIPGPSPTPTVTGSGTWPASGPTWPIWPGSGSTPCGSRRSTARRWSTSATTSATTATSTPSSAPSTTSTRLIEDAHALGLRVIIDWVPNHTSDRHPWFVDAASGPGSAHRNWYVWRDARPDGSPPNNWVAAFDLSAPAWTLDEASGQWYLHLFEAAQPDLNWDEPGVVEAMHDVLRFWLDRGVDGFRADVIHCIGKDPELPDDPPPVAGIPHSALNDEPVTHDRLRAIRRLVDGYPGDRVMVGEVYLLSTERRRHLLRGGRRAPPGLQLPAPVRPVASRGRGRSASSRPSRPSIRREAWPTWVLSNHDNPRHRTRYDRSAAARRGGPGRRPARRSEARARAAAVLLLTLRGTPFLYQGEELGLLDAVIPADRRVDPGGRDGCRAPIPWDGGGDHGWPGVGDAGTWLPFPPDAGQPQPPAARATTRLDPPSVPAADRPPPSGAGPVAR